MLHSVLVSTQRDSWSRRNTLGCHKVHATRFPAGIQNVFVILAKMRAQPTSLSSCRGLISDVGVAVNVDGGFGRGFWAKYAYSRIFMVDKMPVKML